MEPGNLIRLKTEYRVCHLYDRQSFDASVTLIGNLYFVDFARLNFITYNCSEAPLLYLGPATYKIDGRLPHKSQPIREPKKIHLILHQGKVWYHMGDKKYSIEKIFEICNPETEKL